MNGHWKDQRLNQEHQRDIQREMTQYELARLVQPAGRFQMGWLRGKNGQSNSVPTIRPTLLPKLKAIE